MEEDGIAILCEGLCEGLLCNDDSDDNCNDDCDDDVTTVVIYRDDVDCVDYLQG